MMADDDSRYSVALVVEVDIDANGNATGARQSDGGPWAYSDQPAVFDYETDDWHEAPREGSAEADVAEVGQAYLDHLFNGGRYLDRIHAIMDGAEWSPDTLDEIASVLLEAGYTIHDPADACPDCEGSGIEGDENPGPVCLTCKGEGYVKI